LRSALLVLLLVTAVVSFVLSERTDAVITGVILAASDGLGDHPGDPRPHHRAAAAAARRDRASR
jgi:hypothetical protein